MLCLYLHAIYALLFILYIQFLVISNFQYWVPLLPRVRSSGRRCGTHTFMRGAGEPDGEVEQSMPSSSSLGSTMCAPLTRHLPSEARGWYIQTYSPLLIMTIYSVLPCPRSFSLSQQYFQVQYAENNLKKYIHQDDDTRPFKLGDGTVGCDSRFMLGINKRATIMVMVSQPREHPRMWHLCP